MFRIEAAHDREPDLDIEGYRYTVPLVLDALAAHGVEFERGDLRRTLEIMQPGAVLEFVTPDHNVHVERVY